MTKNHILIKSVALGVLLMLSPTAKAAGGVDQVLVAYFKKLHVGASPKCSVDDMTKTRILSEIEPKCLIRTVQPEGSYISGVKSGCTEISVKGTVDAQVNALCENSAFKADQAAVKQQALAEQRTAARAERLAAQQARDKKENAVFGNMLGSTAKLMFGKKNSDTDEKEERSGKGKSGSGSDSSTAAGSNPNAGGGSGNSAGSTSNSGTGNGPTLGKEYSPLALAQKEAKEADDAYDNCDKIKDVDCSGLKVAKDAADKKLETVKDETVAEGKRIAAEQKEPIGSAGKEAVNEGAEEGEDPELTERHKLSRAEDKSIEGQLEAMRKSVEVAIKEIQPEASTTCTAAMGTNAECPAVPAAVKCLVTNMQQLDAQKKQLQEDKESCSNTSAQAEKMCSMVRSKKAKDVQKVMSVGAAVLSKVTAASDACGTTSDISKIAQGGMLLAQGTCSAMKIRCDLSCASAKKMLLTMERTAGALKACKATITTTAPASLAQVETGVTNFQAKIKEELSEGKSVPNAITQCKNHKTDIALMGLSALGFLSAFQDAQECKKQLASGNGDGGKTSSSLASPTMSTAEYCSMPNNAASLTCKCTTNPNAEGCLGSLAKSGVNIGKIGNNGGASAFASAGSNGLGALKSTGKNGSGSDELAPGANLSEAAREALGISAVAPGDAVGTAAGGAAGSAEAARKAKEEEKEKPKYSFFSNLGSMLSGGRKPDQAAKAAIRGYEQDQAIKRKLASDQVRAEISGASGKSNFDKIRSRYQQNAASFEQ